MFGGTMWMWNVFVGMFAYVEQWRGNAERMSWRAQQF